MKIRMLPLLFFNLSTLTAYAVDLPLEKMSDPTEGFNYHFNLNSNGRQAWETQRSNIAQELANRVDTNAKLYNNILNGRQEFIDKAQELSNQISKYEKNYVPYEKGNKVYEIQELKTRLNQTLDTIDRFDKMAERSFQRLKSAATKLERFSQQSRLATSVKGQMDLVKSFTGRNMMVYINNPNLPNISETIKGTRIGIGIQSLPTNLTKSGTLQLEGTALKYTAGENILVRAMDGGIVKGEIMGATENGKLVIREVLHPGMKALSQGEYRLLNPNNASSVEIISPTTRISKEMVENPEKFKSVGGRIYEIRPNEQMSVGRMKEIVGRPPALGNSPPQSGPPNQIRTGGGPGGMR